MENNHNIRVIITLTAQLPEQSDYVYTLSLLNPTDDEYDNAYQKAIDEAKTVYNNTGIQWKEIHAGSLGGNDRHLLFDKEHGKAVCWSIDVIESNESLKDADGFYLVADHKYYSESLKTDVFVHRQCTYDGGNFYLRYYEHRSGHTCNVDIRNLTQDKVNRLSLKHICKW